MLNDAERKNDSLLAGYLTEEQLATELSLTTRTLKRWRRERTGPPTTYIGQRAMYSKESVRAWFRSREVQMPRAKSHRPRGKRSEERAERAAAE